MQTQTTQKTSKKWKALQLAGAIGIAVGVVGCVAGMGVGSEPSMDCAATSWTIGLPLLIVGKLGAWWNHG